jgi:class 3 adenylate cyclase/predicted ATPase
VDLGAWLRGLGLAQYEQAFRDNDIDAEVLPELTADDLIGLGITSIGHRRKLLAAIAALRAGVEAPPFRATEADVGLPPSPPAANPAPHAERRQLTVMLCDLVGSTALSAQLDPEEMRDVLRLYQDAAAGAVARFEGHVAKFMGDGVLAYFGWPKAHEDEAERAVCAGLELVRIVATLAPPTKLRLEVRVGVATGLVVVGDLIGEGAAQEEAVVGETPNLAARLQSLAEPGGVVISPVTRQLVGGRFRCADLGAQHLKGFVEPVRAWRVIGEGRAEGRFEARQTGRVTPLVGREHELGLLLDRWQQAKEGEGQIVALCGEAGVGKSRLVRALRERLAGEAYTPVSHFCSPYHQATALYPIVGLLERAAGLSREDPPQRQLDKLEAMVPTASAAVVALFADLLAIPTGGRFPALGLSPQRQKERTFAALLDQLAGLAARQPVLALYEDVHWSDPTTLELLDLAVDRVQDLRVLALVTFRPEFRPPWIAAAHVTLLTLNNLSRRQTAAMVEQVTGGKALPPEVLEQIVAKTDGVPLFVEELTKTVLEAGLLRDSGDRYILRGPLPPLAIPTTLYDSLVARLDRLAPVKEVAQIGAVIGREFAHELIAAVTTLGEDRLGDALQQLTGAELLFRRGASPHATYTFKHALVRDAAYASLLRGKRQQLHARVAAVLEEQFPRRIEVEPGLLAHHWTEADLPEKAVDYRLKAGELAIRRSATSEALAQLGKGLDLLTGLPATAERDQRELRLQIALGVALMAAKGWASPEAGRANARARELCERLGDTRHLFPALYGQWVWHVVGAELDVGRAVGEEFLGLARRHGDPGAEIVAGRVVGTTLLLRGEVGSARDHFEQALALYDSERDRDLAFVYAQDPRVAGLAGLSWALFILGYSGQASAGSLQALACARELGHQNTLGYALLYGCILAELGNDGRETREQAEALAALAAREGSPHFLAAATAVRVWTAIEDGASGGELEELRGALAAWRATGAGFLVPYFLGLLARAEARAGEIRMALDRVAEGLALVGKTNERWYEAELHRLRGELLLGLPEPDRTCAEACFFRALTVARERDARAWELRAATSLARLCRGREKDEEARGFLDAVCRWFREAPESEDLRQARALLEQPTSAPLLPSVEPTAPTVLVNDAGQGSTRLF